MGLNDLRNENRELRLKIQHLGARIAELEGQALKATVEDTLTKAIGYPPEKKIDKVKSHN